jgi:PII-like signaling protein
MIPDHASLLRLYVNGSLRWHSKPLYLAVVETARAMHLAGASVFPVNLSFGADRRLRDAESDYAFMDVPVVVEVVDAAERVEEFLERLRPMISGGFATIEPVRVVHYSHHEDRPELGSLR